MRTTHYAQFELRHWHRLLGAGAGHVTRTRRVLEEYFGRPVVLLNSGRTGIFLALAAYGFERQEDVWVPPWLSSCVLNTISRQGLPTLQRSPRTRAVLIVHQWGYPQRIERILRTARRDNLLVIEDCAFSFDSSYDGNRIGSFGDAAVFSFPKVLGSILGGCLVTDDERILGFAENYMRQQDTAFWRWRSKVALAPMALALGTRDGRFNTWVRHWLERCHADFVFCPNPNPYVCKLFPESVAALRETFKARRGNLAVFRSTFGEETYPRSLEEGSDVVPYLIPWFGPAEAFPNVVAALQTIGVETGVYHFDVNRDMSASDYRKCVAVPVHQRITIKRMREICETIAAAASRRPAMAAGKPEGATEQADKGAASHD